ncbi:unnamed protein product, partial [Tenebrio molitor]
YFCLHFNITKVAKYCDGREVVDTPFELSRIYSWVANGVSNTINNSSLHQRVRALEIVP